MRRYSRIRLPCLVEVNPRKKVRYQSKCRLITTFIKPTQIEKFHRADGYTSLTTVENNTNLQKDANSQPTDVIDYSDLNAKKTDKKINLTHLIEFNIICKPWSC